MQLRPGMKLTSAVSDVEVVVVKAPASDVEVACGGVPMLPPGEDQPGDTVINGSLGAGPLLGKRYADDDVGLEVLCSRGGAGALTLDGRAPPVKGAKPLPSSD